MDLLQVHETTVSRAKLVLKVYFTLLIIITQKKTKLLSKKANKIYLMAIKLEFILSVIDFLFFFKVNLLLRSWKENEIRMFFT